MKLKIAYILNNHLIKYPTPSNISYAWSFGALSGIFLTIQLITGILLATHYTGGEFAFENVEYIMRDVNYGWLMRYLHANSASFFFVCIYIHMARGIFYKSYLAPRHFAWNSGVIIFLLSIITAFIGYVLPWGQMSFWGATVITNLVSIVPYVGLDIVTWLWGGYTVNKMTVIRFFDFHYLLSIILVVLVLFHISFVHIAGSSTVSGLPVKKHKIEFYPFFAIKDFFVFALVLFIFLWIVFYYPNWLGHTDNYIKADGLVTPTHIVPEWYFLSFYAILRSFDDKTVGVIAMISSILVLMFFPFCKEIIKNNMLITGFHLNWFFYLFVTNFILLGIVGSMPAEYPYIFFGKCCSYIYFGSILNLYFFCILKNKFVKLLINDTNPRKFKKKKNLMF